MIVLVIYMSGSLRGMRLIKLYSVRVCHSCWAARDCGYFTPTHAHLGSRISLGKSYFHSPKS